MQEVVCLGDIINKKGNNMTMIKERVRQATTKMISIFGMVDYATFGAFTLQARVQCYKSLYLPAIIYDCQPWSNITMNEINCLSKVQIKFLKRVLRVPVTTPNAFVYLELGVLPIIYEIHKRQIRYLHKILNLEGNDPIQSTEGVTK